MSSKSKLILSSLTTVGLLGAGVATSTVLNTGNERDALFPNVLDVRADDDHRDESELLVSEKMIEALVPVASTSEPAEKPSTETVVPSVVTTTEIVGESTNQSVLNDTVFNVVFRTAPHATVRESAVKKTAAVVKPMSIKQDRTIDYIIEPDVEELDETKSEEATPTETKTPELKDQTVIPLVNELTDVVNTNRVTTPTVNRFIGPVYEAPVVEPTLPVAPIVEETFVAPVVETPVVETPVVETPIVEEIVTPIVEPVVEAPVEPVVQDAPVEPVQETVSEPVVEETIIEPEAPVVEETVEPVIEELVIEEPVVEEPIVEEQPVVEEIPQEIAEPVVDVQPEPVVVTPTEPNTYPIGQCTWGVKEVAPWVGNWWGNAKDWGASATNAGFATGYTPQVGAVIVFPNTMYQGEVYGHVGYVTAVHGDGTIEILESNFNGNMTVGNHRGAFDPNSPWWGGGVYYIYP